MRQNLRIYSDEHSENPKRGIETRPGGNTCRSKQERNRKKVTKRYPVIHTKFETVYQKQFEPARIEKAKIEKKLVIRYFIKNSLVRRFRSGGKDRRRVFYEPLDREGFPGHIAEFSDRIVGAH